MGISIDFQTPRSVTQIRKRPKFNCNSVTALQIGPKMPTAPDWAICQLRAQNLTFVASIPDQTGTLKMHRT